MWMLWIVGALAAPVAGAAKGRSAVGWFFYGLLIWPVAIIHALCLPGPKVLLPPQEYRVPCPACSELIIPSALICPHCRSPHTARERHIQQLLRDQKTEADEADASRDDKRRGFAILAVIVALIVAAFYFAGRR